MPRSTILEQKPIVGSNTITLNFDIGDDANDGFSNPVATIARLQEILNQYDFNDQNITALIEGTSTDLALRGDSITNCCRLTITLNTTGFYSNTANFDYFLNCRLVIGGTITGAGRVIIDNCEVIDFTADLDNITGSNAVVTCIEAMRFSVLNPVIDTVTITNSLFLLSNIRRVIIDLSSVTSVSVTDFLQLISVTNLLLESPPASITGRVLNLAAAPFINIDDFGSWNLTGSVSDTFPDRSFYMYDVKLTSNNIPAYDDDAAAGGAGLTAGEVYQTTGSGAAPLNAAGLLVVKQ